MNKELEQELQNKLLEQIKSVKDEQIVFWGASNFLKDFLNKYDLSFANIKGIIDKGFGGGCYRIKDYFVYHPNNIELLGRVKIILTIVNNSNTIHSALAKELENTDVELLPNLFDDVSDYTKNETGQERIIRLHENNINALQDVVHNAEKNIIYYLWQQKGTEKELIKILDKLNDLEWIWEDRSNEIWLIYISLLIKNKKQKKAKEILKKYYQHFGTNDIERYLVVAHFANRNGITNDNIKKSAFVFENLEKERKKKTFEKLIKNKTIAIVGNGPSELGLKKGKEIDSHDIVIRINNYQIEGFEEDYGSKTDIWIRGCGASDIKDYTKTKKYKYVGMTGDYFLPLLLSKAQQEILYRDFKNNIKSGCISPKKYYDLINKINFPTTGLSTIYTVFKLKPKKLDIYGFSYNQSYVENISTHYFNDRSEKEAFERTQVHNLQAEVDFLKNLFKKENDKKNIKHLANLLFQKKKTIIPKNAKKVHFITFRKFFPQAGAGGGGAVQSANKVLFGENLGEYSLKYSFTTDNEFKNNRNNELWDLFSAVEFVKQKTKSDDPDTVYVTHDYGSAFGLYLLGKKYAMVSHIQGSRVEEKTNFGEKFSFVSKKIIQFAEKAAMENAYCVCYPSDGAYEYFCKSKLKTISKNRFKKGETLNNTLYYIPEEQEVENIKKEINCETFLSVGQLTVAKGMDRHPRFFEEYLKENPEKFVRYIMVGQGPLEKEIINSLEKICKQFHNFSFVHLHYCSYPQIQYLQGISDIYIMLHRVSIFDLATLEVMNRGKCVILSDAGGNPEFNKDNNIILFTGDYSEVIKTLKSVDLKEIGFKNQQIYNTYFSPENFKNSYLRLIENLSGNKTLI